MPIPHFNTSEFFDNIKNVINDIDDELYDENVPIIYDRYREYRNDLIDINNVINIINRNIQFFIAHNEEITDEISNLENVYQQLFKLIDDVIIDTSITENDQDDLLEYIAELNFECEESLKYD